MEIESFVIKKSVIKFRAAATNKGDLEGESALAGGKRGTMETEADAMPSLHKAFSACRKFVPEIMEVNDPEYWNKVQVYGLEVTRTSEGTRSIKLLYTVELASRVDFLHRDKTPFMQCDKNAPGESGDRQVSSKCALALLKALDEAQSYAKGDRSQQRLDLKSAALNTQVGEGKDDGPSLF